jgi:hypothetical protein
MDGDQGAINKIESALGDASTGDFSDAKTEISAAWNDIVTSTEKLLGRATTDAEKLALLGIQTLTSDLATPLGQAATKAIGTAISGALAGQTVAQIGAAVLPTLEQGVISAAQAAGQDAENVVLNTARVMLIGQQSQTTSTAPSSTASASSAS